MRRPRLLLINPNTTASMTDAMERLFAAEFGEAVALQTETAAFGHPVIATRVSYAIGAHAAVNALAGQIEAPDAVVLGCFGDPGLEALREMTRVPVIGLAEAAFEAAARAGTPFAVLAVGPAWRPMLEERLTLHRAGYLCRQVRAVEGTGLHALARPQEMLALLDREAKVLAEAGAESVILGGVALAGFASRLRAPVRILDGLAPAVEATRRALGLLGSTA